MRIKICGAEVYLVDEKDKLTGHIFYCQDKPNHKKGHSIFITDREGLDMLDNPTDYEKTALAETDFSES